MCLSVGATLGRQERTWSLESDGNVPPLQGMKRMLQSQVTLPDGVTDSSICLMFGYCTASPVSGKSLPLVLLSPTALKGRPGLELAARSLQSLCAW